MEAGRAYIVLVGRVTRRVVFLVLLVACERTSADDRERQFRQMRELTAENARWGENERQARLLRRVFAARFKGKVQPGVGCGVCPDMCRYVDLRQVSNAEFHRMYRKAALERGYPGDDVMYQLAVLELLRLGCIVQDGGDQVRRAWGRLLDAGEDPAVRYVAALQAIELGFAVNEGLAVMRDLASGTSKFQVSARIVLEEWDIGIAPSL